ncbi:magnesium-transporting ATPase (P-type) [Mucilaginibacter sp. UYNi724]
MLITSLFMFDTLLFFHSLFRWAVLGTLVYSIYRAYTGYSNNKVFTKKDDQIRHWTATAAHIQLMLGILVYTQSPNAKFSFHPVGPNRHITQPFFFGVLHLVLMVSAIIIITIGSALAKRKHTDAEKFKIMLVWFSLALLIIFVAIPWPFSPLAQRPYLH